MLLSPAFRAGSLDPLGRVGAEESGAAKNGFGAATLSGTGSFALTRSLPGSAVAHLVLLISGALTSPVALNARARAFPKLSRAGAADRFGSGRRGGAAAAGGGREALSYRVSFATARSHQLAAGAPGMRSLPAFRAGSLDPLGRVGAEESGAAKNGFGAATLSASVCVDHAGAVFSFIDFLRVNLSCRP